MKRLAAPVLSLLALTLAACVADAPRQLTITVSGLPADTTTTVEVTTPGGVAVDQLDLGNGERILQLPAGPYVVTFGDVQADDTLYPYEGVSAVYAAAPARRDVELAPTGAGAELNAEYGLSGYADPVGDAVGVSEQPHYDVVFAGANVADGTLTVTFEFAEPVNIPAPGGSPTAGTVLAYMMVDLVEGGVDTTGDICAVPAGLEGRLDFEVAVSNREADGTFELGDLTGGPSLWLTPDLQGTVLTLTGTAPAGAFEGPAPFSGVVGNEDEPTDCFPSTLDPDL